MGYPNGRRFLAWRAYFLSKKGSQERHPFDPLLPVYFVNKKMFAIYSSDEHGERMNLKCPPDWARALRQEHPEIIPGYHMNKKHWNTVDLTGGLSRGLIEKMIDCSYDLVGGGSKLQAKAEAKTIKPRGRLTARTRREE